MKKIILLLLFLIFANASDNFYYQNDKKNELTPIKTIQKLQKKDSNQTIDYYKKDNGQIVGVTQEIIIKLKDKKAFKSIIKKYAISFKQKLTNTLYVVETNSTKNTLYITNLLYNDANIIYAHPNFIKRIDKR